MESLERKGFRVCEAMLSIDRRWVGYQELMEITNLNDSDLRKTLEGLIKNKEVDFKESSGEKLYSLNTTLRKALQYFKSRNAKFRSGHYGFVEHLIEKGSPFLSNN